jgi:hypothetical protein
LESREGEACEGGVGAILITVKGGRRAVGKADAGFYDSSITKYEQETQGEATGRDQWETRRRGGNGAGALGQQLPSMPWTTMHLMAVRAMEKEEEA